MGVRSPFEERGNSRDKATTSLVSLSAKEKKNNVSNSVLLQTFSAIVNAKPKGSVQLRCMLDGAFGEFFGHMAREASLHPISDNLMWNDGGHFMLVSSSLLIGRANRWGNCLDLADFCDHGGDRHISDSDAVAVKYA
ncbi:hypothetical protein TNCV_3784111 [Trichonephila clavipes]|nr:hypothetical protein TNCV_3784111 [Trichonephila clavipes]